MACFINGLELIRSSKEKNNETVSEIYNVNLNIFN